LILLLTNQGIPWICVAWYGAFIALAYMSLSQGSNLVFSWLQDVVAVTTLCNWIVICGVYLRFFYSMKKQGISRSELPWAAPLQPYITWITFCFFILLLLTNGYTTFLRGHWSDETFVSSYFNIPFLIVLYFGFKWIKKTKIVALENMPIRPFIQTANENPEPPLAPKVGWHRFNILWE